MQNLQYVMERTMQKLIFDRDRLVVWFWQMFGSFVSEKLLMVTSLLHVYLLCAS